MPTLSPKADPRWDAARDEHRVALAAYLDAAERMPQAAWTQSWSPGRWTPAQITEHLALAYEAGLVELGGGPPMQLKMTPARRALLRWFLLPHMLFHRSFPRGARAPREVRPGDGSPDRAAALHRLSEGGEAFERELGRARKSGGGNVTHPYFGSVGAVKALRFFAVHLEHHTRQIAALK